MTAFLIAPAIAVAVAVLVFGTATTKAAAAAAGPCDVYASDNSTLNSGLTAAGGVADSAPQVGRITNTLREPEEAAAGLAVKATTSRGGITAASL